MPTDLSLTSARALALAAQGFSASRPTGRIDKRHLRKVFDSVGVIQIDSVNVLVRSQELPLFSRLGDHPRTLIPDATENAELFEYWCHEASHLPIDMWPLMQWKMARARKGNMWSGVSRVAKENPKLVREIRQRINNDGPLVAGDVKTRVGAKGSWWDWDKGKIVLEYLFWTGEITARRRPQDFARVYYSLSEAFSDDIINVSVPTENEARKELIVRAAKSLGVATQKDLFDYHRQNATDARPVLSELVEEGVLEQVRVESWKESAYVLTGTKIPRNVNTRALVSPFDSLVWCRPRIERLWDFHYRIEIYTPAPKRVYGYYVLPFVLGDRIVARVDLKADRKTGELLVPGAYSEKDVDVKYVAEELKAELQLMAHWLGLEKVTVGTNGDLTGLLAPRGQRR